MSDKYDVTEQAIKAERFVRKYKIIIIFIIICALAYVGYSKISTYLIESRAEQSSDLYFKALAGDAAAGAELAKSNANLAAALAISTNQQLPQDLGQIDEFLADLNALNSGAQSQKFLSDLNTLRKAFAALKAGDINTAHALAKSVNNNSNFYGIAQAILHYGFDEPAKDASAIEEAAK